MKALLAVAAAALVALAALVSGEAALALAFGWAPFLGRVLPRVTVDGAAVAVAGVALTLFTAGVHWLGRSWARSKAGRRWRVGWSLAAVGVVFLLFAAGICLIGVTHQVGWLLAAPEPLLVETEQVRGWYTRDSKSNLKFTLLGFQYFQDFYQGRSCPGVAEDGTVLHGWAVQGLYGNYTTNVIDFRVPWNDPKNQKYYQCVIPQFLNPSLPTAPIRDADGYGLNHYAANSRAMAHGTFRPLKEFTDGTATTLLIGEVNANFEPWGRPGNARDPARGVNSSPYGFGGPLEAGGALFGMADGSVRFVGEHVSPAVLRALSTPDGGEAIGEEVLPAPR